MLKDPNYLDWTFWDVYNVMCNFLTIKMLSCHLKKCYVNVLLNTGNKTNEMANRGHFLNFN